MVYIQKVVTLGFCTDTGTLLFADRGADLGEPGVAACQPSVGRDLWPGARPTGLRGGEAT